MHRTSQRGTLNFDSSGIETEYSYQHKRSSLVTEPPSKAVTKREKTSPGLLGLGRGPAHKDYYICVFKFRLMVTIALHNEARVLTLLFSRMAGSTVCAYCPTGQYLNTSGDLAALLLLFSMITRYDLHMVLC